MLSRSRPLEVLGLALAFVVTALACSQGKKESEPAESRVPASSAQPAPPEKPDDVTTTPIYPAPERQGEQEPKDVGEEHQPQASSPSHRGVSESPGMPPAVRVDEATPGPEPDASPAFVEPAIIEVTVPAGAILELELLTALDTSVNRVGDEIQARTISPLFLKGEPVLVEGSYVEGRVTAVQASGKVKGKASIGFTFDRLSTPAGIKDIRTTFVEKEAASRKKKDAAIIGGAAGAGALIGGILGGKKGAAIGAGIGGAGGTGVVLTTKGEEIRIPVGSEINVRLDEDLVLQVN